MIKVEYVKFRDVRIEDAAFLAACREGGGHRTEVTVEGTKEWIRKDDPNRTHYIFEYQGNAVGIFRFDLKDGVHELSYGVHPTWRGKGLGKYMVQKFVIENLYNKPLRAIVKKGNVASEKIKDCLRLEPVSTEGEYVVYESPAFVDAPQPT